MSEAENPSTAPPPERPWFQFTLRTLFLVFLVLASSMAVFGALGIMAFALVLALAAYLRVFLSPQAIVYLVLAVLCLMCLLSIPAIESANRGGDIGRCHYNLKLIAFALRQYEASHNHFPPAYAADSNGKPLHSWRALILPYLDAAAPFGSYDFTQPWDVPKNKPLSATRLSFYTCPGDASSQASGSAQTNYLAIIGPNAGWTGEKPRRLADFGGKAADTVLVVEVINSGIGWAEPKDPSVDASVTRDAKSSPLVISSNHGQHSDFFFTYDDLACANAAMADGSVRFLPPGSLTPERLPKLLEIGGCKQNDLDLIANSYEEHRRPNWPNMAALAVWLIAVVALLTRAVRSRPRRNKRIAN